MILLKLTVEKYFNYIGSFLVCKVKFNLNNNQCYIFHYILLGFKKNDSNK